MYEGKIKKNKIKVRDIKIKWKEKEVVEERYLYLS